MKIRMGFVSNSSSCAFIIVNKTEKPLKLVEFVKENPQILKEHIEYYGKDSCKDYTQEQMIKDAERRDETLAPGHNDVTFGDEDGDVLGNVFDYNLRDGGESESFTWRFKEFLR